MSQLPISNDLVVSGISYRMNLSLDSEELVGEDELLVLRINGVRFAIFDKPITSQEELTIDLKNYNVIFLSPIEAKKDINIHAITIISLSTFFSSQGSTSLYADAKLMLFVNNNNSRNFLKGGCLIGKEGILGRSLDEEILRGLVEKFENGVDTKNSRLLLKTLLITAQYAMQKETADQLSVLRFLGLPIIERHCV